MEQNAKYLARALVDIIKDEEGEKIIVGYDTRESSPRIAKIVAEVLAGYGIKVEFLNQPVPSPYISYKIARDNDGAEDKQQIAGIMITGSHNPSGDNGICPRVASGAVRRDNRDIQDIFNKYREEGGISDT